MKALTLATMCGMGILATGVTANAANPDFTSRTEITNQPGLMSAANPLSATSAGYQPALNARMAITDSSTAAGVRPYVWMRTDAFGLIFKNGRRRLGYGLQAHSGSSSYEPGVRIHDGLAGSRVQDVLLRSRATFATRELRTGQLELVSML